MTPDELKRARKALGMSRSELAKAIGSNHSTIGGWETGRHKVGSVAEKSIRDLMEAKGVSVNNTFKELSAKAAQMEREGDVSAARRCWKKAEAYAVSKTNAHWCQVRAGFCLSRQAMPTEDQ